MQKMIASAVAIAAFATVSIVVPAQLLTAAAGSPHSDQKPANDAPSANEDDWFQAAHNARVIQQWTGHQLVALVKLARRLIHQAAE